METFVDTGRFTPLKAVLALTGKWTLLVDPPSLGVNIRLLTIGFREVPWGKGVSKTDSALPLAKSGFSSAHRTPARI